VYGNSVIVSATYGDGINIIWGDRNADEISVGNEIYENQIVYLGESGLSGATSTSVVGRDQIFTSNNRFYNNRYHIATGTSSDRFRWDNDSRKSLAEFQFYGQEVGGLISSLIPSFNWNWNYTTPVEGGPSTPTVIALKTSDTTPRLIGTYDGLGTATLVVRVNGIDYTKANGLELNRREGLWSLVTRAIPQGTYDVRVTAIDNINNASLDTTVGELVVDTQAPSPATVLSLASNDSTPILTGTYDAADTKALVVAVNDIFYSPETGIVLNSNTGTWSLELPVALANGSYDIRVTAADAVGNVSTDTTINELLIDATAPLKPTVISTFIADPTPVLSGRFDPIDTATLGVRVNGVDYTTANGLSLNRTAGTWGLTLPTALADGTYNIAVTATDAVGNVSTDSTTNELRIDTKAPLLPTVTSRSTNDSTPALAGSFDPIDTATLGVRVNGVDYTTSNGLILNRTAGTWGLTLPTALADGTYNCLTTIR
jgi:large repetitive protein